MCGAGARCGGASQVRAGRVIRRSVWSSCWRRRPTAAGAQRDRRLARGGGRVSLRLSRAIMRAIPTSSSSGGTTPATSRPRQAGASAIRSRSSASASIRRRSIPRAWAVRDLFMTHLAVCDPVGGRYRFDERLTPRAARGWRARRPIAIGCGTRTGAPGSTNGAAT